MRIVPVVLVGALLGALAPVNVQAQVIDRTHGTITRCDLYRSLGRAFPPECGGSGQPIPPVARGKLNLGGPPPAPSAAPAPAASPAATAPAPAAPVPAAIGVGLPILFALDSDVLTPQAMDLIDELVEVFNYNATQKYVIEGHTDITGETSRNTALSIRRAQAVVRYLVQRHGMSEDRFIVRGLGSSQLLLPNDGRNDRNRRVQVLRVDS